MLISMKIRMQNEEHLAYLQREQFMKPRKKTINPWILPQIPFDIVIHLNNFN